MAGNFFCGKITVSGTDKYFLGINFSKRGKLVEKPPCFFDKKPLTRVSGFFDVLAPFSPCRRKNLPQLPVQFKTCVCVANKYYELPKKLGIPLQEKIKLLSNSKYQCHILLKMEVFD
jgi:hypothetical protein